MPRWTKRTWVDADLADTLSQKKFGLPASDLWPYHYSRTCVQNKFKMVTPSKNTAADESQPDCSSEHTNRF